MRLKALLVSLSAMTLGLSAYGGFAQTSETLPMPQSRLELAGRLLMAGISVGGVSRIVALARDAQVLDTAPADEGAMALGASKFGGRPDLPQAMSWPVRPAYEDGAEMASALETEAANLYADAGLAPPWMGKEGEAFLEARKAVNAKVHAETLALMKKAGGDVEGFDFDQLPKPSAEELAKEAGELRARAKALTEPFPLAFILQIDLAEMAQKPGFDKDLPKEGRLLFFYDLPQIPAPFEPQSKPGWLLMHDTTPRQGLKRVDVPPALARFPAPGVLKPMAVTSRAVVSTIPTGSSSFDSLSPVTGKDSETYHQWLFTLGWPTEEAGGNHQLGGWPRSIQSGMEATSQLASNGIDAGKSGAYHSDAAKALFAHASDWQLVLQVGTDMAAGNQLPGGLYVLIRKEDLAARRFDKAWVVYEQD